MASAWGASWGAAFGVAWGAVTRTPQVEPPPLYHGGSQRTNARRRRFPSREALRKRTRRQADEDLLLLSIF